MFYQSFITLTPDSLHGCRDGVIKRDLIKTEQASRITAPHSWIWETIGQGLLLCLTSSRSSFRWWRTQMLRRRGCRGVVCYFQFTLDEMSQQFGGNYSTFYYMMHSCSPLTEEWCVCVWGGAFFNIWCFFCFAAAFTCSSQAVPRGRKKGGRVRHV